MTEASHSTGDPEAIRAEINASRQRVSDDLEAIGHRLNPQYVKEQVKENIREATIGRVEDMARGAGDKVNDVRNGLMTTVRENPLPAALAGIGLAWLFMNRSSGSTARGRSYSTSSQRAGSYDWNRNAGGYGESNYNKQLPAGSKVDELRDRAADIGGGVKDKVGDLTEQAQDVASRVAETGGEQMRRVEDTFYENPLAVGVAALAVGIAAGLAAPGTQVESKLVGEARDQLVEKASEVARETTQKAQRVAERALDETQNAARQEGLVANSTSAPA
jgi:hypothetical protein